MKVIARIQKDTGQGNCFHILNVVDDDGWGWDKVAQVWGVLEFQRHIEWFPEHSQFLISIWNCGFQFLWADCVVVDHRPRLTENAIRTN